MCKIVCFIAAVLFLFACSSADPQTCSNSPSLSLTQLAELNVNGTWYEVARNPANSKNGCIKIDTSLSYDNTTLKVNVTQSSSPSSTYQNVQEDATVQVTAGSTDGFNVSFTLNGITQSPVLTKVLSQVNTTDGMNWLVGCGYTNASDVTTSFGFLLARGKVNSTGLNYINGLAAANYTNFNASSITTVLQDGCTANSAVKSLPAISGLLMALYLFLSKAI